MDGNNGFGPIFERRGKKSQVIAAFLVLTLSIVSFSLLDGVFGIISLLISLTVCIYGEMLRRFCLFCEEILHIKTRYNGNTRDVFAACFLQSYWKSLHAVAGASMFISAFIWHQYPNAIDYNNIQLFALQIWFVPLLSYLLGLREVTQAEVSEINEHETKNVADGLAWSFYFGYLKLILPSIKETINLSDNEVDEMALRDHISDHKVFIVIPKDCNCFQSFAEVDPNIQFVSQTHEQKISRAGVQLRVYKNSIYRIRSSSNQTFYCLMEYATPLLSMFEMEKEPRCGFTAADKDLQAVLLYKRLKEILEADETCRGKYHLVLTSNAKEELADVMAKEIMLSRQNQGYKA